MQESNFQKIKLANGLRVILVPQAQSLTTTILVSVEAGSRYETKEINGLSHFLEHMCFKGTEKRPRAIDISIELDSLGAQHNAYTSQEMTSYYVKARKESFNEVLDVIADMYLNPVFDIKEIEKERGVIIEEINMREGILYSRVQELFMQLLYGDQPAGWDVIGVKEVIRRLTREDILNYRQKHYLSQATAIVIAGGFDEAKAIEQVKNYFAKMPQGNKSGKLPVHEFQEKPAELIKFKDSDQTHLVMGFRSFGLSDERKYALEVLSDILGGSMSSRLFQKIREEMGVAYYVNATADMYTDHGALTMAAGVDHGKVQDVIKAALEEFVDLKDKGISEAELKRAKEHLTGNLFLSLETSDELGGYYATLDVLGQPLITPEELGEKIKAVSASEIQAVAQALIKNEDLNLAVIGPFKDKTFVDILKV